MSAWTAASLFFAFVLRRSLQGRRPSPEATEQRRREQLAASGRITDGVILASHSLGGADTGSSPPEVLVYSYRIAGVTYQCAQDVSCLRAQVPALPAGQSIVDQSVQVRYDPRAPGNSILVSETWTGLWKRDQ